MEDATGEIPPLIGAPPSPESEPPPPPVGPAALGAAGTVVPVLRPASGGALGVVEPIVPVLPPAAAAALGVVGTIVPVLSPAAAGAATVPACPGVLLCLLVEPTTPVGPTLPPDPFAVPAGPTTSRCPAAGPAALSPPTLGGTGSALSCPPPPPAPDWPSIPALPEPAPVWLPALSFPNGNGSRSLSACPSVISTPAAVATISSAVSGGGRGGASKLAPFFSSHSRAPASIPILVNICCVAAMIALLAAIPAVAASSLALLIALITAVSFAVSGSLFARMSLIAWLPCEAMPLNRLRSSVTASATAPLALLLARQCSWASSRRSFPTRKRSSMSSAVRPWFRDPNCLRWFCTCAASRPLTSAWSDQYALPAVGSLGSAGHHAPTNSRDHSPGGRSVTAHILQHLLFGIHGIHCPIELCVAGPATGRFDDQVFVRLNHSLGRVTIFGVQCRIRRGSLEDDCAVGQSDTSQGRIGTIGLDVYCVHGGLESVAKLCLCFSPLSCGVIRCCRQPNEGHYRHNQRGNSQQYCEHREQYR